MLERQLKYLGRIFLVLACAAGGGMTPLLKGETAKTVRDFGAAGDGLQDDTNAFERAVASGQGVVRLPRGRYRLTRTITIDLDSAGPFSLAGDGTATVIMGGPGPAFRFIGTHAGTADPDTVKEDVWLRQRTPMIDAFEIVGDNAKAAGVELDGTMQATISRLVVRRTLHAIRLTGRNRNVIVSECHIYNNRGVGILLERLNLHQVNISNSHISYNGGGGVVVRDSEVRNLHIGTCDIESNMDPEGEPTANVLIDVRNGSVREGAITGSTLQHNHESPDSANIRLVGNADAPRKAGYFSIGNNALSDVMVNIHLKSVRGVSIVGNSFWKGFRHDLLVEGSSNITVGPNTFDRNPDYRPNTSANGIVFRESTDCTLSGLHLNGSLAKGAALLLESCRRMNISGASILNYRDAGVWFDRTGDSRLSNSLIHSDDNECPPVKVTGGAGNVITNNSWSGGPEVQEGTAELEANNSPQ